MASLYLHKWCNRELHGIMSSYCGIWPCQVPGRWWLSLDEIWKMKRSSFGECFLQRWKSMCKGLQTIKNFTGSRIWKQANMTGVKRWRGEGWANCVGECEWLQIKPRISVIISAVLTCSVIIRAKQITKLQIAGRSAWVSRPSLATMKAGLAERSRCWRTTSYCGGPEREAVGSDIRWYWCRRVEPDGAKSWESARGCTTKESKLRSCQVVGLDGWGRWAKPRMCQV